MSNRFICDNCFQKLEKYRLKSHIDNDVYSIFKYESIIRDLIIKYKFENKSYLYKSFTICILFDTKVCKFINSYDIITIVPLHYFRFLARGYNQTKLIAKEISKRADISYLETLNKIKNIKPQPTKNFKERIKDVKGIYVIKNYVNKYIINKRVLIFDDILTTGATTRECKNALINAGAKNVGILTLARGIDKNKLS